MNKKVTALCLCALLALSSLLAGCGGSAANSITVFNWEDYIDPAVRDMFTKETGIKINYTRFTTNEDMYIKLTKAGGAYDVVFPSDYMIERLISEGQLQPLNPQGMENFENIMPWLQNPDYDKGSVYSAPYMWGTVGILYNIDKTGGEIDSWAAMWDTKYKKDVYMMDSIRDTLGITLKYLGYSLNAHSEQELNAARDKLIEQGTSGVRLAFGVDEIKDKLENNEVAMGLVWSGDALTTMAKNSSLRYVVPKEGSNVWVDGMVIPKSAKNPDGARQFIDFLMRPDIAAMNSEYIGYSTPNAGAMEILGPDYQNDPTFNPTPETLATCEFMHDLKGNLAAYERVWMEIKGK